MNTNTQSTCPGENADIPAHVMRYIDVTRELDDAVRAKNTDKIKTIRRELQIFYAGLSKDEQEDIRVFTEREFIGKMIEGERGKVNRAIKWALHAPYRLVRASKEPIARLTGETLELILITLGWTIGGIVRGVRGAVHAVLQVGGYANSQLMNDSI